MRSKGPTPRHEPAGHIDALLDQALQMTFPASDPIALAIDTMPARAKKVTSDDHGHRSRSSPIGTTER